MHVVLPQIGVTPQLCEVGERTPDETKCLEEARAAIHEWSVYLMPENLPAPVRLRDRTKVPRLRFGVSILPDARHHTMLQVQKRLVSLRPLHDDGLEAPRGNLRVWR